MPSLRHAEPRRGTEWRGKAFFFLLGVCKRESLMKWLPPTPPSEQHYAVCRDNRANTSRVDQPIRCLMRHSRLHQAARTRQGS
jgi:hypothetical protein